jgi:hypothetical protein
VSHFLYKLIPPRPTFDRDMNEAEATIMGQHAAYWQDQIERGSAIVFGPVADPARAWVSPSSMRSRSRRCGPSTPQSARGRA